MSGPSPRRRYASAAPSQPSPSNGDDGGHQTPAQPRQVRRPEAFCRKHRVGLNANLAIERAYSRGRQETFDRAKFHGCTERQSRESASARSDNPLPEHRGITWSTELPARPRAGSPTTPSPRDQPRLIGHGSPRCSRPSPLNHSAGVVPVRVREKVGTSAFGFSLCRRSKGPSRATPSFLPRTPLPD